MRRRGGGGGGVGGVERKGNACHCAQQTFYRKPFVNERDALSFPFPTPSPPAMFAAFQSMPSPVSCAFFARLNEKVHDYYMYVC